MLRRIREQTGLDKARVLITGAAPISLQVLRFFHALGLEILEGYGMSENMTVTTLNRRGQARLGTVGQAVDDVEIRVAGDGEICMRGDVVFAGYYRDPAATAEAVVDGWLHTGDIGDLDADGYLRITDRKKDLIITAGGKNVSPSNIEDALRSDLIANPVVIGDRRPYIVALLTLDRSGLEAFAARARSAAPMPLSLIRHPVRARRSSAARRCGQARSRQRREGAALAPLALRVRGRGRAHADVQGPAEGRRRAFREPRSSVSTRPDPRRRSGTAVVMAARHARSRAHTATLGVPPS